MLARCTFIINEIEWGGVKTQMNDGNSAERNQPTGDVRSHVKTKQIHFTPNFHMKFLEACLINDFYIQLVFYHISYEKENVFFRLNISVCHSTILPSRTCTEFEIVL